jgi:hypothetical protein
LTEGSRQQHKACRHIVRCCGGVPAALRAAVVAAQLQAMVLVVVQLLALVLGPDSGSYTQHM